MNNGDMDQISPCRKSPDQREPSNKQRCVVPRGNRETDALEVPQEGRLAAGWVIVDRALSGAGNGQRLSYKLRVRVKLKVMQPLTKLSFVLALGGACPEPVNLRS